MIPLLQGYGLGAGLIIAIGAQNAFVLRQRLKRQHLFVTASISTLCDAILILLGVGGLGALIANIPVLTLIATWGGAVFLLFFGLRSFRSAVVNSALNTGKASAQPVSTVGTIIAVIAFSLLNPHVYLDTVVLVGSVGAHYQANERVTFALGAMAFRRDLPNSEVYLLDTGHFALEEDGSNIAEYIRRFLKTHLA